METAPPHWTPGTASVIRAGKANTATNVSHTSLAQFSLPALKRGKRAIFIVIIFVIIPSLILLLVLQEHSSELTYFTIYVNWEGAAFYSDMVHAIYS